MQPEVVDPVVGGHAPVPVGRVAQVPHRRLDILDRLQPREHHSGDSGVEQPPGADPLGRLDAGEHGDAVRLGRDLLVQQGPLVAAAVLEVGEQPVEAGDRAGLGGQRRAEAEERAVQGLAGGQPGADVRHRRCPTTAR